FDLDSTDTLVVTDASGKRIKSATAKDSYVSPLEVLSAEAEANRLLKKNNGRRLNNFSNPANGQKKEKFQTGLPLHRRAAEAVAK
ncbi:MAG TPA: hypothetical protein VG603_08440, partial [Chitinophagales bacterium]|nr:hypothetical protein [Chitinophagales bacterium]